MFLKKDKILFLAAGILLITYILSFTKSCKNTDKREVIKTALVNQKYENSITSFTLSKADSSITLTKKDNLWLVNENNSEITIPASTQKVQNFVKDLISIRNMYKLSDSISKNNSFGLQNSDTFTISYTFPDGIHSIYFGNQDFALTSRFLMTDKNTVVYEIDSTMDKYLTTNSLNWTDPYIISQEVLGKITEQDIQSCKVYSMEKSSSISDLNKLIDLRHGGFPDFTVALPEETDMKIELELGNKTFINLEVYSTNLDSEYIIKSEYIKADNSKYYSCVKISSWTYNKIKDITL